MSDPRKERDCVVRLLAQLGRSFTAIECLNPPAPDIRAKHADGSVEIFEVTEIHPDENRPRGRPLFAVTAACWLVCGRKTGHRDGDQNRDTGGGDLSDMFGVCDRSMCT